MRPRILLVALLVGLCSGMVGCDHATKQFAQNALKGQRPVQLISGVLDLRYVENFGIGFNVERFLPQVLRKPIVYGPSLLAMPFLLFMLIQRNRSLVYRMALALLLAGAIGNALDRWTRGYVIDFIYVHYWPIFNVADICLCVGAGLFILDTLRNPQPKDPVPA